MTIKYTPFILVLIFVFLCTKKILIIPSKRNFFSKNYILFPKKEEMFQKAEHYLCLKRKKVKRILI